MTPKEKAKELVDRFSPKLSWYNANDNLSKAKQFALICVDENIKIQNSWLRYFNNKDYIVTDAIDYKINELYIIKQEIEKL